LFGYLIAFIIAELRLQDKGKTFLFSFARVILTPLTSNRQTAQQWAFFS
jgi:hypothetical protein